VLRCTSHDSFEADVVIEKRAIKYTQAELLPLIRQFAGSCLPFLKVPPRGLNLKAWFVHTEVSWKTALQHKGTPWGAARGQAANFGYDEAQKAYFGTVCLNLPDICASPPEEFLTQHDLRTPFNEPKLSQTISRTGKWSLAAVRSSTMQTLVHELWHLIEFWQVARDLGNTAADGYYAELGKGTYGQMPLAQRLFRTNGFMAEAVYKLHPMEASARQTAHSFVTTNLASIQKGDFDKFVPIDQLRLYAASETRSPVDLNWRQR
jgi:hypothetical protein